jgi:hypothetical protein
MMNSTESTPVLPEVVLIDRRAWKGDDGLAYVHETLEIRGGDVAPSWAAELRVPRAAWCSVTLWNDGDHLASWGGEVWPAAWPQLFLIVGTRGREKVELTVLARELIAIARQRGVM